MKQKTLIYGLIIIFLLSAINSSAQMPSSTSLIVNYALTSVDTQLKPGDSGTLIIVIQNTGGLPAKEVEAKLSYPPAGISAYVSSNLGTINPGTPVTIKTTVTVSNTAKPGTYTLPVKLYYKSESYDFMGKLKTDDAETEWQIPIRVYGDASFQVKAEKNEFYKDVTDKLVLKGMVKQEVRNVYAQLASTPALCASIIGSERIYLGSLKADQDFVLEYTISPKTVGTCSMSVNFDYDDASGSSSSEVISFGLDFKRSNVDIKVLGVEYPLLNPGDTSDITIKLKNVGGAEASDATVTLGLTMEDLSKIPQQLLAQMAMDYPFVIIGSPEKHIESISGGETSDVSFKIRINKDAKTKAYEIPLKIKYFDSAGTGNEISKTVGIEIKGKPEISVKIKESDITTSKNIGKITVDITNKGSSDVQFLDVKLIPTERYSIISGSEEYIGTIESDNSESADFNIKVFNSQNGGTVPIALHIEYKDNYNNEYSENLNVDLNVNTDSDLGNGSNMVMMIVIILVVVVVVYFVYKKIRK